jgi:hypothetical protein
MSKINWLKCEKNISTYVLLSYCLHCGQSEPYKMPVLHSCTFHGLALNLILHSGGKDQEDSGLRPARAERIHKTHINHNSRVIPHI